MKKRNSRLTVIRLVKMAEEFGYGFPEVRALYGSHPDDRTVRQVFERMAREVEVSLGKTRELFEFHRQIGEARKFKKARD